MPTLNLTNRKQLCRLAAVLLEMRGDWYEIHLQDDGKAEIVIYDVIGDGFLGESYSAKRFLDDLEAMGDVDPIVVRIHSPGGDPFAASSIGNRLRNHPASIHTIVDGEAASAASIIFGAGDRRTMGVGTALMIHNPWTISKGDYREAELTARRLRKLRDVFAKVYTQTSNRNLQQINDMMDAETWIDGDEAVEWGFATDQSEVQFRAAAISAHEPSLLWRFVKSQFQNNGAPLEVKPEEIELLDKEMAKPERTIFQMQSHGQEPQPKKGDKTMHEITFSGKSLAKLLNMLNLKEPASDDDILEAVELTYQENAAISEKAELADGIQQKLDEIVGERRSSVKAIIAKVEPESLALQNTVDELSWNNLVELEKTYRAKLDKQFGFRCQNCGSEQVQRRSSLEEELSDTPAKPKGKVMKFDNIARV